MQTQTLTTVEAPVLTIEEAPSIAHLEATVLHSRKGETRVHNLRVSVAYQCVGQEIAYGVAYCSPRDNFSRRLGRTIAQGRLAKTPWILFNPDNKNPLEMIKNAIRAGGPNTPCHWLEVSFAS